MSWWPQRLTWEANSNQSWPPLLLPPHILSIRPVPEGKSTTTEVNPLFVNSCYSHPTTLIFKSSFAWFLTSSGGKDNILLTGWFLQSTKIWIQTHDKVIFGKQKEEWVLISYTLVGKSTLGCLEVLTLKASNSHKPVDLGQQKDSSVGHSLFSDVHSFW